MIDSHSDKCSIFFCCCYSSLTSGLTEVVPTVGGKRGEGRLISNRYLCHHQNDFRIKMGKDVSHFNVSLIVQGTVTRQVSINHIL